MAAKNDARVAIVGYIRTRAANEPVPDDDERLQAGRLANVRVRVSFDNVPLRQAIAELASVTGLRMLTWYGDDTRGLNMDPRAPVTLALEDAKLSDALQAILDQSGAPVECTWQIRRGLVEVGPKPRLALEPYRSTITYDVRDLLIEAPMFVALSNDGPPLDSRRGRAPTRTPFNGEYRKGPSDIAGELIDEIIGTVEPLAWVPTDESAPPIEARKDMTAEERLYWGGRWAVVRYADGKFTVTAPEFVHRQIDGGPDPIPPVAAPVP